MKVDRVGRIADTSKSAPSSEKAAGWRRCRDGFTVFGGRRVVLLGVWDLAGDGGLGPQTDTGQAQGRHAGRSRLKPHGDTVVEAGVVGHAVTRDV